MAVYNNELYVGGDFSSAGGKATYNIARWNGTQWDSVSSGLVDVAGAMTVDTIQNILYVGGGIYKAGNINVWGIAKWNGNVWANVGTRGITNGARTMTMYHNELYVGGQSSTGSVNDTIIGKWNGNYWTWIKGPNNTVNSFKVYNDTLYVGGYFTQVGSAAINYIARWYTNEFETIEKEYLGNNIPNPFSTATSIPYYVPAGSKGVIKIYGMRGELIKSYTLEEGHNQLEVSIEAFQNGLYLCTLSIDDGSIVRNKKMLLYK
jgi:hypothetical protein